ncbi:MAG: Ni/Fe-hydrogenase cytochrome b subunit [candidate division KSB1 bacterium]|nr:Ni/Fe-hydrogenase cytochrome b subunit [candidate division KSB1 bacterium]MDZ7303002.1 Ni/Fe-hydrogenase cytochrome b subunit [candidate division KSB1 bacterium]MDZ7312490.1 Ni/Fe-hydrogenase cytochrome b subunit [candidate division KSB1 bacterium]
MKLPRLTFWKIIAAVIFALGLYATAVRFVKGLGASTNLTDEFPWGIWIGFDLLVGVGLAAGGFVIAATVHIFNIEKYESISRPAILTAFLGYLLVIIALLYDLGRPYRIWHPLIMWNPHSVMFEVGWCVMLYTTVLALEFSPVVFEKFNLKVPLKLIRSLYLPIVIAGVLLSTLHQSSLGTLYVIVPDKLYGLWYSPLLPVFFFISAIAAGLAMTIIESFLSYRAFGRRLEKDILDGLARVIVVVLAVYFVFKFQDLNGRGNLHLAFEFNRESVLFWGEMGLGAILPMILLFSARIRAKEAGLLFSALLVVIGFIVNRLNVSITGMLHSETYFPKWTEIAVTMTIVALGFTIFAFAVKYFAVFPKEEMIPAPEASGEAQKDRYPVFTGTVVLGMWALALIGLITLGLTKKYEVDHNAPTEENEIASRVVNPLEEELRIPDDFVYPLGEGSPGAVTFSHQSHVYIKGQPDCTPCHTGLFEILKADQSKPKPLTMAAMYEGQSCGKCHNGKDAFSAEENCEACHTR